VLLITLMLDRLVAIDVVDIKLSWRPRRLAMRDLRVSSIELRNNDYSVHQRRCTLSDRAYQVVVNMED